MTEEEEEVEGKWVGVEMKNKPILSVGVVD